MHPLVEEGHVYLYRIHVRVSSFELLPGDDQKFIAHVAVSSSTTQISDGPSSGLALPRMSAAGREPRAKVGLHDYSLAPYNPHVKPDSC